MNYVDPHQPERVFNVKERIIFKIETLHLQNDNNTSLYGRID